MKKITIFLSAILLCLFIFVGSSYAANEDWPDVQSVMSSELPQYPNYHYILVKDNGSANPYNLYVFPFNMEGEEYAGLSHRIFIETDQYGGKKFHVRGLNSTYYKVIVIYFIDGVPDVHEILRPTTSDYMFGFSDKEILQGTINVYNGETSDEIFFQPTPLEVETPVEEKQEITLAPIVEEVEAKKTLAEVVGILPLIIVVVVSLVGLRKALKMLLAVLHRA